MSRRPNLPWTSEDGKKILLYFFVPHLPHILLTYSNLNCRAKTIKNSVSVNEELTAEEWKRRYEKEKEKTSRLRGKLERAEEELERWRKGETVSADEQVSLKEESASTAPTPNDSMAQLIPPKPAPVMVTSTITAEERLRLEGERERLYQQLDEKDDEINQQCQLVEKLKEQLLEQEELITTSRKDYEKLQQEMARIQAENEAAKDEVKEVLQALEELALNYDQKAGEADAKSREFEVINDELSQKQTQLNSTIQDLQQLRDMSSHQKKKTNEMLASLLQDLNEIGQAIGAPLVETIKLGDKVEEEFTAARLLVAKTKAEVKNLVHRCQSLETTQTDCNKKVTKLERTSFLFPVHTHNYSPPRV
jgi:kinesin family protein 5